MSPGSASELSSSGSEWKDREPGTRGSAGRQGAGRRGEPRGASRTRASGRQGLQGPGARGGAQVPVRDAAPGAEAGAPGRSWGFDSGGDPERAVDQPRPRAGVAGALGFVHGASAGARILLRAARGLGGRVAHDSGGARNTRAEARGGRADFWDDGESRGRASGGPGQARSSRGPPRRRDAPEGPGRPPACGRARVWARGDHDHVFAGGASTGVDCPARIQPGHRDHGGSGSTAGRRRDETGPWLGVPGSGAEGSRGPRSSRRKGGRDDLTPKYQGSLSLEPQSMRRARSTGFISRTPKPREAVMPNKTWIITGAVVVAAVIGYVALRGPQVPRKGTEGAIGAAKRYQSQQISNQDVTLDS